MSNLFLMLLNFVVLFSNMSRRIRSLQSSTYKNHSSYAHDALRNKFTFLLSLEFCLQIKNQTSCSRWCVRRFSVFLSVIPSRLHYITYRICFVLHRTLTRVSFAGDSAISNLPNPSNPRKLRHFEHLQLLTVSKYITSISKLSKSNRP